MATCLSLLWRLRFFEHVFSNDNNNQNKQRYEFSNHVHIYLKIFVLSLCNRCSTSIADNEEVL
jgi:hypothetical protein